MTKSIEWDRVAPFYDLYAQATFDIPFFTQEATKIPGDVLELMAGTGRVSLPLVKAGVHLTCVDNAPEMLAVLRQKLAREHLSAQVYTMAVPNSYGLSSYPSPGDVTDMYDGGTQRRVRSPAQFEGYLFERGMPISDEEMTPMEYTIRNVSQ